LAVQKAHRPHLTALEDDDFLRNVLLKIHRSRALNDFIEARDRGMVEDVVVEAIVEAVADLFQKLAELISTPSPEL
jgi:hypothetical protein